MNALFAKGDGKGTYPTYPRSEGDAAKGRPNGRGAGSVTALAAARTRRDRKSRHLRAGVAS